MGQKKVIALTTITPSNRICNMSPEVTLMTPRRATSNLIHDYLTSCSALINPRTSARQVRVLWYRGSKAGQDHPYLLGIKRQLQQNAEINLAQTTRIRSRTRTTNSLTATNSIAKILLQCRATCLMQLQVLLPTKYHLQRNTSSKRQVSSTRKGQQRR